MNGPTARARRVERGQATLEFLGALPIVLVVILLCLQAFISVVAYERVHNAARTGARLMTMQGLSTAETQEAAQEALPGWLVEDPSAPACGAGQSPDQDDCTPEERCVSDGEEQPWEKTCVFVGSPGSVTVRTEIPLLFPGAPLIFPIEATVEMPT